MLIAVRTTHHCVAGNILPANYAFTGSEFGPSTSVQFPRPGNFSESFDAVDVTTDWHVNIFAVVCKLIGV